MNRSERQCRLQAWRANANLSCGFTSFVWAFDWGSCQALKDHIQSHNKNHIRAAVQAEEEERLYSDNKLGAKLKADNL